MNIQKIFFCISFVVLTFFTEIFSSAITTEPWPGRLGDQLVYYAKTKWLSFKYGIPLLLRPFKHSDKLALHELEKKLSSGDIKKFNKVISITDESSNDIQADGNILYKVNYHVNLLAFWGNAQQDKAFLNVLKKMIKPRVSLWEPSFPAGFITLAVHVRKGSGPDKPLFSDLSYSEKKNILKKKPISRFHDWRRPLLFPPEDYYIDQVKRVSTLFMDAPLYVYIFTDAINPRMILERFKKAINKTNVIFDCREKSAQETMNILDDLFAMVKFDCLIKGSSNFSNVAKLIGDHKIIISPKHAKWIDDTLIIDEVSVEDKRT